MSIMSKLTKKTVKITVIEETKLSQVLYWILFLVSIVLLSLKLFLDVPGYAAIVWIVCFVAYFLSNRNNKFFQCTNALDIESIKDTIDSSIINEVYKNKSK